MACSLNLYQFKKRNRKSKDKETKRDMNGQSQTPQEIKLQQLKEILPEVFAEGKVDWEKLKATLGEDISFTNERYVLNWAGKSDAFKALQTPTTKSLIPAKDESVNFDQTDHIFIEGENLEVLKVLQKSYFGRVKMIYIDPPYNTGNDSFVYPDKFSETRAEYQKRVGDKDEAGYMTKDGVFRRNSRENGQYHSNWLNMMMPRLYLAKNLLRQDGVIFVSIDDNEVHNLRLLMNEVFGEENFVACIIREAIRGGSQSKNIRVSHDYVLCFSKNVNEVQFTGIEKEGRILNLEDEKGKYAKGRELNKWGAGSRREDSPSMFFPIKGPNGVDVYPIRNDGSEGRWRLGKAKMNQRVKDNDIIFEKRDDGTYIAYEKIRDSSPRIKQFTTLFTKEYLNAKGTESIKRLFDIERSYFDYVKPIELMHDLILMSNPADGDIILDFFSGSSSTAHSVVKYNHSSDVSLNYIMIQLPELTPEDSEAHKAGYKTISDVSKDRIRMVGKKAKQKIEKEIEKISTQLTKLQSQLPTDETKAEIATLKAEIEQLQRQDLGFKVLKLSNSNFKQWQQVAGNDAKALEEQMKLFVDPVSESATTENMVYELLLKSGKDLNSTIEHKANFHCINGNEMVLMLEKATQTIVDNVIALQPAKVIALDRLFEGNDQLKTNTVLQMKDAGVEFKTI